MRDGPPLKCPLCKRPAHCNYHYGWTQTIKCDDCGFNYTYGVLESPPEQQRDISLLTNLMPTVSPKDINDWCGYDVKKAAIAARSAVSLEPWLETKHAINAALHNKGDAFTRKDEEVADINLSVSAPSPISPCEIRDNKIMTGGGGPTPHSGQVGTPSPDDPLGLSQTERLAHDLRVLAGDCIDGEPLSRDAMHAICMKASAAILAIREPVLGNGVEIPLGYGNAKLFSIIFKAPDGERIEILAREFYDAD